MSVSPGDVVHVVIEATLGDGSIVQNRKRFKLDSVGTLTDAVVLTSIKAWVETLYGFVATQTPLDTDLEDGTADVITWNPALSIWEVTQNIGIYSPLDTFADASDPLPPQCSAFVIGDTSRPKSKGRIFVFPFGKDRQDAGILGATTLAAVGLLAAQYISDQSVGADTLLSGIVRENADVWLDFLTASFGDVIGTQRRRRLGVGQ